MKRPAGACSAREVLKLLTIYGRSAREAWTLLEAKASRATVMAYLRSTSEPIKPEPPTPAEVFERGPLASEILQ